MIQKDESTHHTTYYTPIQPDRIYLEDCLQGMKRIPDGSIDLILCDLPYGTTQYRWDSVIPTDLLFAEYCRILKPNGTFLLFGSEPFSTLLRMQDLKLYKYDWVWEKDNVTGFADAKNKPMKRHELISVFSKGSTGHKGLTPEGRRMTYNPQGLIYLGDAETGGGQKGIRQSLPMGRQAGIYPPQLESSRSADTSAAQGDSLPQSPASGASSTPRCGRVYRRGVYSAILRGKRVVPAIHQRDKITPPMAGKRRTESITKWGGAEGGLVGTYHNKMATYIQEYTNYPTSILHFAKDKCNMHPSQKPLELLEYLIRTYSNEGETILGNCMGSGSTAIASLNTNRHFIGFELNPRYFEVCQHRLEAYVDYRKKHGHGKTIEDYASVEWQAEAGKRRMEREAQHQADLEQRRKEAAEQDFFGIPFSQLTADES